MARAPFQILLFPFIVSGGDILYGLFRRHRSSGGYWQGIAGGGEEGECPARAAVREAWEEAGVAAAPGTLYPLQSRAMLPVTAVCGFLWGPDILLIPEDAFGLQVKGQEVVLSAEHSEARWAGIDEALALVRWDSNRTALWELDYRIRNGMLPSPWDGISSVP